MATVSPNRTQECEDVAQRCFYVAKTLWNDTVVPRWLAWRDFRTAHPELASLQVTDANRSLATQDQALYVAFITSLTNDVLNSWIMPATVFAAAYRSLIGNWNGQRCLSGAVTCQPTSPIGSGYIPDPGSGGEGTFGGNPINPPYDPSNAPQPSSNPQCYTDSVIVEQIIAFTKSAYDSSLAMMPVHGTFYDIYPVLVPMPSPSTLAAWNAAFTGLYNVYVNLWFNTYCGDATPVQLSPTMPHPVPLPVNPFG